MRSFLFLLLWALLLGPLPLRGQETAPQVLQGRVVDADTGAPLPGAHVFFTFSTLGTTTDNDGRFRLDHLPPGGRELAVSMLGYGLETRRLDLPGDAGTPLDVRLKPMVLDSKNWLHATKANRNAGTATAGRPTKGRRSTSSPRSTTPETPATSAKPASKSSGSPTSTQTRRRPSR